MPSHQLKLYYFANVRGRAEAIRMILKLANVPYEDVQISFDQWPAFKPEMPLGQVPVLEIDGCKLGQSVTICRYLGEEYGLAPKDNLVRARLNMIVDLIIDTWSIEPVKLWGRILLGILPTPGNDKATYFREQIRPNLDNCASLVEKHLIENAPNALLSGDQITWADIFAAEFFSKFVDFGEKDCLEAYPQVQALVERVQNEPSIKKHIEQRPKVDF